MIFNRGAKVYEKMSVKLLRSKSSLKVQCPVWMYQNPVKKCSILDYIGGIITINVQFGYFSYHGFFFYYSIELI